MSDNDDQTESIFIYEEPNSGSYHISFADILGNETYYAREFEMPSFDRNEIKNDNQNSDDYFSEVNAIFSRIADAVYENQLEQIMEDRMMTAAMNESLNYYKTQERKPNVELCVESQQASDKHITEKCAICKEDFELEENITPLVCNHTLHTDCIKEWVKYKSECPVCRQQIQTKDVSENED